MCKLLDAQEFLKIYNYDISEAARDGAEREFREAESVVEQERIDIYDQMIEMQ